MFPADQDAYVELHEEIGELNNAVELSTKYNEIPNKPVLFIDMDGVTADFNNSPYFSGERKWNRDRGPHEMYEQFFFETLQPIPGALSEIRRLMAADLYDVNILTKPVRFTHYSYSEKAAWIWKWFPELGEKLTLTQNKTFLAAPNRILIDDSKEEWGENWTKAGGTFIHFDYEAGNHAQQWKNIVDSLLNI